MSTHRAIPRERKVPMSKMPRGPNGRRLCRFCQTEVPKGRVTFCSDGCVHEWNIRSVPAYARQKVWERDQGVCGRCRLDTDRLQRAFERVRKFRDALTRRYRISRQWTADRVHHWPDRMIEVSLSEISTIGAPHLWEAHHKVAVVEGGGECGLDGLETLCRWCHRDETAELARRRAEARRGPPAPELPLAGRTA